jgi:hypothetical protein
MFLLKKQKLAGLWHNVPHCRGACRKGGTKKSPAVVDYFKALAGETGLPYQKLIDLYLLDCAKKRKKLTMRWVA